MLHGSSLSLPRVARSTATALATMLRGMTWLPSSFPTPLADIEAAQEAPDIPRFPRWAVILSSSVALAGIYVYWEGKRSARIAASKTK